MPSLSVGRVRVKSVEVVSFGGALVKAFRGRAEQQDGL